jgi:hypothetical protein
MSRYLVDRIERLGNVEVLLNTEVNGGRHAGRTVHLVRLGRAVVGSRPRRSCCR